MRPTPDTRQKSTAGASLVTPPPFPGLRPLAGLAASAVLAAAAAACTPAPTVPAPRPTSHISEPPAPAAEPSAGTTGEALANTSAQPPAPDAAATETVRRTVTDTLTQLAAGTPKPATSQVTDALTAAGFASGALQVSQSRTPTGLEADAIEAAVLQGSDCVIGQVREGTVMVTVLPVLASGKCFVGS
ncbi:DUF6993 domain-containing protein [Arthrobacter sp. MPF02]|uniref:DUF6993 domain-containing protein n=1 Tax=Arthrobacter sp. MPF02 TaxID=3388492 RepID=UPI003984BFCC